MLFQSRFLQGYWAKNDYEPRVRLLNHCTSPHIYLRTFIGQNSYFNRIVFPHNMQLFKKTLQKIFIFVIYIRWFVTFFVFQTDVYRINAVSLGSLYRVVIGHDGIEPGAGWFLEKIVVKVLLSVRQKTWCSFACKVLSSSTLMYFMYKYQRSHFLDFATRSKTFAGINFMCGSQFTFHNSSHKYVALKASGRFDDLGTWQTS